MAKLQTALSDVEVKRISLKNRGWQSAKDDFDLIPFVQELNIYEDIFSSHLRADITFVDAFNLPSKLPIVGEEEVIIVLGMPGIDDDELFVSPPPMHIYRMMDRHARTPQSQQYILELVSEQYMSNIHTKVSRSYNGERISSIAKDIWETYLEVMDDEYDDSISVEQTDRIESCVIPNWTPHQALNWLSKRARPKNNKLVSNYLYYETLNGSFFVSMNSLMENEPLFMFSLEPRKIDPTRIEGFTGGVIKADKIEIKNQFHLVQSINRGQYASKLITHDLLSKNIEQHEYNMFDNWFSPKVNHCGDMPTISNEHMSDGFITTQWVDRTQFAPPPTNKRCIIKSLGPTTLTDNVVLFASKHNQMFSSSPSHLYDNEIEEWKLQRNSQLALMDGTQILIQCGGLPIQRVGMTAHLHMMSPQSREKYGEEEDKMLSGKYLTTSVRHVFTSLQSNSEYKTYVELMRDGCGGIQR